MNIICRGCSTWHRILKTSHLSCAICNMQYTSQKLVSRHRLLEFKTCRNPWTCPHSFVKVHFEMLLLSCHRMDVNFLNVFHSELDFLDLFLQILCYLGEPVIYCHHDKSYLHEFSNWKGFLFLRQINCLIFDYPGGILPLL